MITRIGILLKKEFFMGIRNFFLFFAFLAPLAMSLLISLAFGTVFSGKADLGIYEEGQSEAVQRLEGWDEIRVTLYTSEVELKQAVADGKADFGLVVPEDFDIDLKAGNELSLATYIWGESRFNHRLTLVMATSKALFNTMGYDDPPIKIKEIMVGDQAARSWYNRLMPFAVLISVAMSGILIAGSSLMKEKMDRSFAALVITPAHVVEVYIAKSLFGIICALFMGMLVLIITQSFGIHPWMLISLLAQGAVMTTFLGLLLGSMTKDNESFMAMMKPFAFFFYTPAILYIFPKVPEWIGMFFPTYYLIKPITLLVLEGKSPGEVIWYHLILLGINFLMLGIVIWRARKVKVG